MERGRKRKGAVRKREGDREGRGREIEKEDGDREELMEWEETEMEE